MKARPPATIYFSSELEKTHVVTKYFDPKYLGDVENGKFRFGTNALYRNETAEPQALAALGDETEGLLYFKFNHLPSRVKSFRTPYCEYYNTVTPAANFTIRAKVNDHTFCVTEGEYIRSHHEAMVQGDIRFGYLGNPTYTGYCQINLKSFLSALLVELKKKTDKHANVKCEVIAGRVSYTGYAGKVIRHTGFLPEYYEYELDMRDHVIRSYMSKPPLYEIEREIRIIAPMYGLGNTPVRVGAEFYESAALKGSIINIGTL